MAQHRHWSPGGKLPGHFFGLGRAAIVRLVLLITIVGVALVAFMYWSAISQPEVRRTTVELQGLDSDRLTIAFVSDIHVAGPDMPPQRLRGIISEINALKPDLVLIAGDFVSDKRTATHLYSAQEALQPLVALTAPYGTYAVPGNHDHWRGMKDISNAMQGAGIKLLRNSATSVGPVSIAGVDDAYTGRADVSATLDAVQRLNKPIIMLSHSPDIFPDLPRSAQLTLAGHTHCGQIRFPVFGAVTYLSAFGDRYACGRVRENGKTIITSGGLGTSILPLRLGTPPEIWFITLVPKEDDSTSKM